MSTPAKPARGRAEGKAAGLISAARRAYREAMYHHDLYVGRAPSAETDQHRHKALVLFDLELWCRKQARAALRGGGR